MHATPDFEIDTLRERIAELEHQLSVARSGFLDNPDPTSLLRAILDSSDDAIITEDLNGIIQSWNHGAERTFGYSASEAVGKPAAMLVPAERAGEISQILETVRRGERIHHYETLRRTKDGQDLPVSLTGTPIRNAAGLVVGACKVVRDISAGRAIDEVRERLAAIVESSDDAIISKDLNGMIRSWNHGAERIFGYTAAETVGRHISMLAVPERLEEIPDILARIRRGERVEHYETRRRTKDGRVLNISLTVSPVRDASGQIVGASKIARDITDRKVLETRLASQGRLLAERERFLQAVMESMPECVKVLGPAGEVLEMNRAGLEMIEVDSPEQVIGQCIYLFVDEPFRDLFRQVNENVFHGGSGGALEYSVTGAKGTRCFLDSRVVPLRDENNAVIGGLSVTRDISDRKRSEEVLQASEERFRAAATAVSSLIWTTNAQGQMDREQTGWAAFTGQGPEEYQGFGWVHAVHPGDAPATLRAWRAAVAARSVFGIEHRLRRSDGLYRLFSVRAVPVFDQANGIREWVGVHTDITDERRLIEERAHALEREQEARQTAELLNRVGPLLSAELETQSLTQKVTDIATQLVGAQFGAFFHNVTNQQGESYLLYTISGAPKEHFSHLPMPRNTKVFAPTFAGEGIVRSDDITSDPRYGQNPPYSGMPSGHLPVRSYLAAPVVSRSGEVLGGLFFGHEKTGMFTGQHEAIIGGIAAQAAIALDNAYLFAQAQRAREDLARSNEELRHANADLEQFAFSASHDLKEPLRHVAIYSQIVRRRLQGKLDPQTEEHIRLIVDSAQHMDALVSGLLAYTRAGSAEIEDVRPIAAGPVFEKAIANLQVRIEESSAVVECEPLPIVAVHEVHLVQLFQNLVGNALKYRAGEAPRIRVSAQPEGEWWRLCVDDNGIGIEPEYAEQIFGLFKRLHSGEQYAGTGIGLALCQRIVHRYGGRIWVESEGSGRGARFLFTLPGA